MQPRQPTFSDYLNNFSRYEAFTKKPLLSAAIKKLGNNEGNPAFFARIFNELPFSYRVADASYYSSQLTYTAFDSQIWQQLTQILQLGMDDSAKQITLSEKGETEESKELPDVIERYADSLFCIAMNQGYNDLFNQQGKLNPALFALLRFKLPDIMRYSAADFKNIIFPLFYSYCSQIIMANLADAASKKNESDFIKLRVLNKINLAFQEKCGFADDQNHFELQITDSFQNSIYNKIFISQMLTQAPLLQYSPALKKELITAQADPAFYCQSQTDFVKALYTKSKEKEMLLVALNHLGKSELVQQALNQQQQKPLLAHSIETHNDLLTVLVLIDKPHKSTLSEEELTQVNNDRSSLVKAFLSFLGTLSVNSQNQLLDNVVSGQNAFGQILKTPTSSWGLWLSGETETTSIRTLKKHKDTINAPAPVVQARAS